MVGSNVLPSTAQRNQFAFLQMSLGYESEERQAPPHEQVANLRLAQQLLDIVIWKMEVETGRLVWCDHAHNVFRVARKELPADFGAYLDLVHSDDRGSVAKSFLTFPDSTAPLLKFGHRVRRKDGSIIHVRGVAEREDRDGSSWLSGVVQDVTAEVTSREELVEAHRMQHIAERTARLGGWRVDLDPIRITWSPETCAIHGEPTGTSPDLDTAIGYYTPEHRDRVRDAFTLCAQSGRPFDEVALIVSAKGDHVWVRTIGEPVHDAKGAIIAMHGAFQDISEMVAMQDQSENLARRLLQTLENISDAFFLLDHEWRFSFLNGKAVELLRCRRDELLGQVKWDAFPEAVGTTIQQQFETAMRTGQAVWFQEYFAPLESWFDVDAYPTPEGLAVYFRDVTQQREREEHLRLLEAAISRQNDILMITEFGSIDAPDSPKIAYVNDAFVKLTGFSREEAIGQTPRILQGPKTQRSELDRIRRALENWHPVRAELINYTKAGEEFWLELDIVPIADKDGRLTNWVSIERDITERKRNEEAMLRSEERFRLVTKATNDVISDRDMVAGSVWWNENLRTHFGYDSARAEPGHAFWATRIHPDDQAWVTDSLDAAIAGSASTWTEEYRFMHADGRTMTVADRAFIIRDAEGKAIRMLGSMADVTAERDTESRLRQAQKLEAVGQLTGGIAHDFNNMLTIILGNAEMLGDDLGDRPKSKKLADTITATGDRATDLTNRLLSFSRKQPLQPQLIDLGAQIQGMEHFLRRTLPENIVTEIVCPPGLWAAEVDPSQLESAVLNLALNARDAMPDGGRLVIETDNVTVDETVPPREQDLAAAQYVRIIVTDTGAGISPDALAHVFEPFFTTKEVGEGSGLGLSMVYGFVKQSGGHISVRSTPGKGTSFTLYFPRATGEGTHIRPVQSAKQVVGGNEAILMVEDDALVREHLVAQLEGLGYGVAAAASGPEAMEILKDMSEIDLLFTDTVMPGGMNGRELADAARALHPHMKVLFTSGYADNALVHRGRLDPDVELLSKPYRREHLAEKVRKVLDHG